MEKTVEEEAVSSSKKRKRQKIRKISDGWNFDVDYNDHFETPLIAYEDLIPFMKLVCKRETDATKQIVEKQLSNMVIYDPYYCKGKMVNSCIMECGSKFVIDYRRRWST